MLSRKLVTLENGEKTYVRPILIGDILPLHKMYSSLSEESKKFFHPSFFESTGLKWFLSNLALLLSTFSTIRRLLVNLWPKAGSFSSVAVNVQNELIGFVYLRMKDRLVDGNYKAAVGICVRDDYHNAGLGSKLLGLIVELAKAEKVREVFAWILIENVRSIHIFRKYGFKKTNLIRGCTRWKGKDYDCLEMYLHLL